MTSRPVGRRGLFLGTGTLLVSGLLAACSDEPAPPPDPPTGKELAEPTPVQTTEQFTTIVSEVSADVVEADEARDASLLSPRVGGSAYYFRRDSYAMIAKSDAFAQELAVPGTELVVPMSSVTAEFPRVAIALVEDSVEGGTPYFMALRQNDAKSSYTSWGWARQATGVEMPTVPSALVGSEQVAADDDALVMTPAEALALYAKVLTDGDKGDPEDQLAPNPFQSEVHERIQSERTNLNKGVERDEAATVRETYAVKEDEFAGLRTDDGGAIVMGTLLSTRTVTVKNGATLRLGDDNVFGIVIGGTEFTEKYVRTYGTHVALYIPTADAGGQVQPIGATRTTLTASGT